MFRRHPIFTLVLGLLLATTVALAVFLVTFDLDRYRQELQQSLTATLNRPVILGKAQLTFARGPAFDFSDLMIGAAAGRDDGLQASHLLLRLDWDDLLQGRITFAEIVLEQPRLKIDLPPTPPDSSHASPRSTPSPPWQALNDIQVRTLRIHNGSLHLTDRRQSAPPSLLTLVDLDIRLQGLSLAQAIDLEITGALLQEKHKAAFSVKGRIKPEVELSQWQTFPVELALAMEQVAVEELLAGRLPADWPLSGQGRASLNAELKGSVAAGLDSRIELRGEGLQLRWPQLWQTPRVLNRLQLQGKLTRTDSTLALDGLHLNADDLALAGTFVFSSRDNHPWISATLASSPIPLTELLELQPLQQYLPSQQRLHGGTLQVESASLDCAQTELQDLRNILEALEMRLALRQTRIQLDLPTDIEELYATVDWNKGRLALTDGQARFENLPLHFSGELKNPWDKDFPLHLSLDGTVRSHTLLTLAATTPIDGLVVTGPLPFNLNLSGSWQTLSAKVQADLSAVGCRFREAVNKPAGLPGRLELLGSITPEKFQLQQGLLQLPPLDLKGEGTLSRRKDRPASLQLAAKNLDLKALRPHLPLLEQLAARGSVDLSVQASGTNGSFGQIDGVATLNNVGVHLTRVIADLNDANGTLLFSANRAETRNLTLKLGSSPLEVQAKIASFADPTVDILVKSAAVRADDIIFHNDQAYLRQLDGHLRIDRHGIFFDPVKVSLDGGTEATVRGAVNNFSAPEVVLDIEAEYGHIDEVIALWHRPAAAPAPQEHPPAREETKVFIAARAHNGQLGNLRFQNAKGDITLRHGVLTIFPLHFDAGSGTCQGHVAADLTTHSAPLLKISGHLENFDASAIYHELLQRKGLVSGTLQGDFYLEGAAGKGFLESSSGGFAFSVDNGVLRKFQFLSKVFSILNVSQILALHLPDMDLEGMPFNRLNATAAMRQGIVTTNDLFIESNAMNLSLIGSLDLNSETLDMVLGVKPLRTVDKVVTNIPIAGWILTGDEKALITAQFEIKGKSLDPQVSAIPVSSLSSTVLGIFKRVLGLPGKVVSDVGGLFQ